MLVKRNIRKVRVIGHGRGMSIASYKKMRGDGFFDIFKSLFSGGVKLIGNLFRSSGAKQLAVKALTTAKDLGIKAVKEGATSLAKDVASDPMKYVEKATELVNKLKDNPQEVAKIEGEKFAKQMLNIAKEKVVQPTIDQYRDEFEGVKQNLKQEAVQNNIGNLIAGMGLKKRGRSKATKIIKESQKGNGKNSNNKIMNKLRGAGLVPL
jgi:hypothetical protein